MDYKLAKQLKEAGFPQNTHTAEKLEVKSVVKIPTLSELIKACGERFLALNRYEKTDMNAEWGACATNAEEFGKTPEEAVAKLWLKLHG